MEGVYVVRNCIVEYFAQSFVPNFAISLICTRTSGNLIMDFLGLLLFLVMYESVHLQEQEYPTYCEDFSWIFWSALHRFAICNHVLP